METIIIGELIKREVKRQNLSADDFAKRIACERANVYKIYQRHSIDTALLGLISQALNHNFFSDIVQNPSLSGYEDKEAMRNVYNKMAIAQFTEVVPKILMRHNIEPCIFFGRPLDIPEDIPLPDFYISSFNITFSLDDLLCEKANCNLSQVANIKRVQVPGSEVFIDCWEFITPGCDWVNLKLDYKTEQEWDNILSFVFKTFYDKYNIFK